MPTAYCEESDVQEALLESDAKFGNAPLDTGNVTAAIHAASGWFARQTNGHWYDSTKTGNDLIDSTDASASNVRLSMPSSPHRQRGQVLVTERHLVYPVTHHGPYTRISLPHPYVTDITTLEVRDRGGGVTDWVADSGFVEGRGEDYYIGRVGQHSYGRTNLYIRARSIGPRTDYDGILTLDYDHGLDYQTEAWDDVKRGIAALAASQLLSDQDVLGGLPDNANLPGYETQVQRLSGQAFSLAESAGGYLSPYLSDPVE